MKTTLTAFVLFCALSACKSTPPSAPADAAVPAAAVDAASVVKADAPAAVKDAAPAADASKPATSTVVPVVPAAVPVTVEKK